MSQWTNGPRRRTGCRCRGRRPTTRCSCSRTRGTRWSSPPPCTEFRCTSTSRQCTRGSPTTWTERRCCAGGGPGVVQPQGGPQLPGISAAELAAAFAAQVQGQGGPGQGVQGGPPLPALNPGINTAQLAAALAAQLAGQGIQPPGPAVPGAQHNQGDGAPPVPNASNMGNAGVVQPQLDLDAEEQSIAEEVARNPESEIKEANIYKPQRDYQHLGFEDMETG